MCDGPDSGLITQTRPQTTEHRLKVGAFAPGSSMTGLVEHPAHVFVAFRRTAAGVLFGSFYLSGTGSHPGSEFGRGGERAGCHSYFGFMACAIRTVQLCDLLIK